ncbi:MAG TPA: rhodanese-like domain-containing protein [Phycisphaerales bacterium]|nr:rhodanese-like domain-containing protein [Phycisphaerales bacterium]
MIRSYLIKLVGIVVVASAAGVTHMLLGPQIKLHPNDPEVQTIDLGAPDAAPASADPAEDPTTDQPTDAEAGSDPVPAGDGTLVLDSLEISLEQAKALYDNGLADFIDARPAAEYAKGHIYGSWNVPPSAFDRSTPTVVDLIDPDRIVVVYCTGGDCHDSHIVIREIQEIRPELTKLHVFTDGYPGWAGAGYETDIGADPFAETGG